MGGNGPAEIFSRFPCLKINFPTGLSREAPSKYFKLFIGKKDKFIFYHSRRHHVIDLYISNAVQIIIKFS